MKNAYEITNEMREEAEGGKTDYNEVKNRKKA